MVSIVLSYKSPQIALQIRECIILWAVSRSSASEPCCMLHVPRISSPISGANMAPEWAEGLASQVYTTPSPSPRSSHPPRNLFDIAYAMPKGQEEPTGNDGWIRVGMGKGRTPMYTRGIPLLQKDMTAEKLRAAFDQRLRTWQGSACRKELRQILDRKQPDGGWQTRQAICIGSGSFSRDNWEYQKRSMSQFVAFMDTIQHVQSSSDEKIHIIVQDPVYTQVDIEFLTEKGITVYAGRDVHQTGFVGPNVEDHLGPESMVFEPFMDMGSRIMRKLLNSDMKLYIGVSLRRREQGKGEQFRYAYPVERSITFGELTLMLSWCCCQPDGD